MRANGVLLIITLALFHSAPAQARPRQCAAQFSQESRGASATLFRLPNRLLAPREKTLDKFQYALSYYTQALEYRTTETIRKPESYAEKLALFEAAANKHGYNIFNLQDRLAAAKLPSAWALRKISGHKNLRDTVVDLYYLTHANPRDLDFLFENGSPAAINEMIFQRIELSFAMNGVVRALEELGFYNEAAAAKATPLQLNGRHYFKAGFKSFVLNAYAMINFFAFLPGLAILPVQAPDLRILQHAPEISLELQERLREATGAGQRLRDILPKYLPLINPVYLKSARRDLRAHLIPRLIIYACFSAFLTVQGPDLIENTGQYFWYSAVGFPDDPTHPTYNESKINRDDLITEANRELLEQHSALTGESSLDDNPELYKVSKFFEQMTNRELWGWLHENEALPERLVGPLKLD